MDVMDNSRRKVVHGPASGSEHLEFPMPVVVLKSRYSPLHYPRQQGVQKVVWERWSLRVLMTLVPRRHVPVQRTAECYVHFSTEATMLAEDHSGSGATVSTDGQPPTRTEAGSLNQMGVLTQDQ